MRKRIAFGLTAAMLTGCVSTSDTASDQTPDHNAQVQLAQAREKIDRLAMNSGEFIKAKNELQKEIDSLRVGTEADKETAKRLQPFMDRIHLQATRLTDAATAACWATGIDATQYGLGGYSRLSRVTPDDPPPRDESPATATSAE